MPELNNVSAAKVFGQRKMCYYFALYSTALQIGFQMKHRKLRILFLLSPNSLKMRDDNSFSYDQYHICLCSEALVFVLSSYISQCHHHRSDERTSFHILCSNLIAFLWMLVAIKHFPPALHTLILSYDKQYNRNFLCIRSV